jgi:hypothetical protein
VYRVFWTEPSKAGENRTLMALRKTLSQALRSVMDDKRHEYTRMLGAGEWEIEDYDLGVVFCGSKFDALSELHAIHERRNV